MPKKTKYPARSKDVLVTQKMLFVVRDELSELIKSEARRTDSLIDGVRSDIHDVRSDVHGMKAEIRGIKSDIHGMKSDIHGMKSDIHGMKSDIHGMKSDIHGMKADIHGIKSDVHGMRSEIHRIALLVEEQNARNAIVLDGLTSLFERQDRLEKAGQG